MLLVKVKGWAYAIIFPCDCLFESRVKGNKYMFKKIGKIFMGDPHSKRIEELVRIVDQINSLEPKFEALSDEQLKAKTF